jgi:hypothetical protein
MRERTAALERKRPALQASTSRFRLVPLVRRQVDLVDQALFEELPARWSVRTLDVLSARGVKSTKQG